MRRKRIERRHARDHTPLILLSAGAVALVIAAVWWWLIPESQREFSDCFEAVRCRRRQRSAFGWAATVMILGLLLLALAASSWVSRRRRAQRQ